MIPMHGEPSGHPAQEQDPEEDKGSDVQQGVVPVQQPVLWISGDDEKLKRKQRNISTESHILQIITENLFSRILQMWQLLSFLDTMSPTLLLCIACRVK